jgi:hypothetical protein
MLGGAVVKKSCTRAMGLCNTSLDDPFRQKNILFYRLFLISYKIKTGDGTLFYGVV